MIRKLLVVVLLAGCPGAKPVPKPPYTEPPPPPEQDLRTELVAELQDDILKSYVRDEPPEHESGMWLPEIGPARIGVAPDRVQIAAELARPRSRYPLELGKLKAEPKSKRLEIHLSRDSSAAWTFDEISYRIQVCPTRTAVVPLRVTSLYTRDGDRWVPVFEHLSFARPPTPTKAGEKLPRQIFTAVSSRDLVDDLTRALSPILRRAIDKSSAISTGSESALIGPDVTAEWHGPEVVNAKLVPGTEPLRLEDRRVGVLGRTPAKATIAYWIGNVTADLPGGKAHYRVTFVFEKHKTGWVVVQGHLSHAIEDADLAAAVFGSALLSPKPLTIVCDDSKPPADPKKQAAKP